MSTKALVLAVLVGSLPPAWYGIGLVSRVAYESADYTVVRADGAIELRRYPELAVASVASESGSRSDDTAFMQLFQYISGQNERRQEIAMTVPVFMNEPTDESRVMSFVMPKELSSEDAPGPLSEQIRLRTRPAGLYAVIRFSGQSDRKTTGAEELRLRAWIEAAGLRTTGERETAVYDPPMTPGPLRRNEVLLRVTEEEAPAEEGVASVR